MSAVPTIYLARHGETAWSKSGQHTGRTDLPLTPRGEADARRLGERLAGVTFSRVFSSPLSRAYRTAELAGFTPEIEPDLAEWSYGEYEGRTKAEIQQTCPGWDVFLHGCPGGETPEDLRVRCDRLAGRIKGLTGNILCFAHGHLLRVLGVRWIGQPVALAGQLLLSTGSLSVLSFDHLNLDDPAIKSWNCG